MHRISVLLVGALVLGISLGSSATAAAAQEKAAKPKPAAAASTNPINLNTATLADLQGLPGVGAATAKLIVEHREKNGASRKWRS